MSPPLKRRKLTGWGNKHQRDDTMIIDLTKQSASEIMPVLASHGLRIKAGTFNSSTAPKIFEIKDSRSALLADLLELQTFLEAA